MLARANLLLALGEDRLAVFVPLTVPRRSAQKLALCTGGRRMAAGVL